MKTFEYDILSFPMTRKTSLADMQASLNVKGAEGWEVVSISSSASTSSLPSRRLLEIVNPPKPPPPR